MAYDSIAIVGVGLIGGSIGLAARRRGLAREIIGIGRSSASLAAAVEVGAVTQTTTNLADGAQAAELIVVCTPVDDIAGHVRQAAAANQCCALITDAGSTKATLIEDLDRTLPADVRYVGSHPMAGSHARGPAEADADLFLDRAVIITPTERNSPADVEQVMAFWAALGARVVSMSPREHDHAVAAVSHLPHLAAAALMQTVRESDMPLAAGGLRDTTRIALGDAELWKQIVLSNRGEIVAALGRYQTELQELSRVLEAGDGEALLALLRSAQRARQMLE